MPCQCCSRQRRPTRPAGCVPQPYMLFISPRHRLGGCRAGRHAVRNVRAAAGEARRVGSALLCLFYMIVSFLGQVSRTKTGGPAHAARKALAQRCGCPQSAPLQLWCRSVCRQPGSTIAIWGIKLRGSPCLASSVNAEASRHHVIVSKHCVEQARQDRLLLTCSSRFTLTTSTATSRSCMPAWPRARAHSCDVIVQDGRQMLRGVTAPLLARLVAQRCSML